MGSTDTTECGSRVPPSSVSWFKFTTYDDSEISVDRGESEEWIVETLLPRGGVLTPDEISTVVIAMCAAAKLAADLNRAALEVAC